MSSRIDAAQAWVAERSEELLESLRESLRIPSLEAPAEPGAPFGPENRRALDHALALCSRYGMKTHDVDGFCGWAEYGEGEPMVMILGHLDVVPVGPGWEHEPFGAELDGGYVYSRGATDDKGPTFAALYAALALKETNPVPGCRVRVVFGCNEESGFKCIERYLQTEEKPTFGVAPDAGWPLIHGEKGIADFLASCALPAGQLSLISFAGGQRPNIVIDSAEAVCRVAPEWQDEVKARLAKAWDRNITAEWRGDELVMTAVGKAAHGSYPHGGDNAAIRLMRRLVELAPDAEQAVYSEILDACHIAGLGIGVAGADDASGPLSCNLGIIAAAEGRLHLTLNIRYPVTWSGQELQERCRNHLSGLKGGWSLDEASDSPPLYFPLEHPMVKAITDAYRHETGDMREPRTMGGGTYARAVPNSVAIGTGWEGDGPAHETDERLKVDHLHKMARIYVRIFHDLAELAAQGA